MWHASWQNLTGILQVFRVGPPRLWREGTTVVPRCIIIRLGEGVGGYGLHAMWPIWASGRPPPGLCALRAGGDGQDQRECQRRKGQGGACDGWRFVQRCVHMAPACPVQQGALAKHALLLWASARANARDVRVTPVVLRGTRLQSPCKYSVQLRADRRARAPLSEAASTMPCPGNTTAAPCDRYPPALPARCSTPHLRVPALRARCLVARRLAAGTSLVLPNTFLPTNSQ